jgi:hypothetical protein
MQAVHLNPGSHVIYEHRLMFYREHARRAFDLLWRGENAIMTREEAYAWLGRTLGISEPKLSRLETPDCVRVLRAVHGHVRSHRLLGRQIDDALAAAGMG